MHGQDLDELIRRCSCQPWPQCLTSSARELRLKRLLLASRQHLLCQANFSHVQANQLLRANHHSLHPQPMHGEFVRL